MPAYRAKFPPINKKYTGEERRNEGRLKIEFRDRMRKCKHRHFKLLKSGYSYGPWEEYLCFDCGCVWTEKIDEDGGFRIND